MMRRVISRTKADVRVIHELLLDNDVYYPLGIAGICIASVAVVGGIVWGIVVAVNAK